MLKTCVIGASGYTGAELARLLNHHPDFELSGLFVSANSQDADKNIASLHGSLFGLVDMPLQALSDEKLAMLPSQMDAIFLATPHEASHDWMPSLVGKKAKIFDLSGAFRLQDLPTFSRFYGFEHQHSTILSEAVYGLADWNQSAISQADLVAVPGCYPTAALTGLKPLFENQLLAKGHRPIVNAVSGVSGAGRKAALSNSFCEVSLQAYGVLGHRHQPEIAAHLGDEVIFTPHLGNFKRGILATITVKLDERATPQSVDKAFAQAYADSSIVRLQPTWPKLEDVVNTPFCDLHWKFDCDSGYLVISSAIDNLLKGAASQALQCANIRFGFDSGKGLVAGAKS